MDALDTAWNSCLWPILDDFRRDGWWVGLPEPATEPLADPEGSKAPDISLPRPERLTFQITPPGASVIYKISPEPSGDALVILFGLRNPAGIFPEVRRNYQLRLMPPEDRKPTEDPVERLLKEISAYHERQSLEINEKAQAVARFQAGWLTARANDLRISAGLRPLPSEYRIVADRLRREGKKKRALLVEFMAGRESADCREVGGWVHDDEDASEQTIRMNAQRTNDDLASLHFPVRFQVSGGKVFKETSPE